MASLAEFSYGGDSSAVEGLISELVAKVAAAQEVVTTLTEVETALDSNWAGKAEENFKANLANDASKVSTKVGVLLATLSTEIQNIMSEMQSNDMHMFS